MRYPMHKISEWKILNNKINSRPMQHFFDAEVGAVILMTVIDIV